MTFEETKALVVPLALALHAEFDGPTQRAYHRILKDVPVGLAQAGIAALEQTPLRFLPTATEIQAAAERARRQLVALHPYEGCVECEHQRGFRTVITESGQKTVEPCPCKARHQARLHALSLAAPLAQLPGEAGAGDEATYPTVEQLPAPLQARLHAVTSQKVLR